MWQNGRRVISYWKGWPDSDFCLFLSMPDSSYKGVRGRSYVQCISQTCFNSIKMNTVHNKQWQPCPAGNGNSYSSALRDLLQPEDWYNSELQLKQEYRNGQGSTAQPGVSQVKSHEFFHLPFGLLRQEGNQCHWRNNVILAFSMDPCRTACRTVLTRLAPAVHVFFYCKLAKI